MSALNKATRSLQSALRIFGRWLFALALSRFFSRRSGEVSQAQAGDSVEERRAPTDTSAEGLVIALMSAAVVLFAGFLALYVVYDNTQLLGLTIGGGLLLVAAASVVAGKRIVPQETAVEERPDFGTDGAARAQVAELVTDAGQGLSRRKLLGAATAAAGAGLGTALLAPVASLGPTIGTSIKKTPWHDGVRLVDEFNKPLSAADIHPKGFLTAFPEGAEHKELAAPLVVVQVPPSDIQPDPKRDGWAPEGILAFSKICTHAGCAVALYRAPLYEPTTGRGPALVCPCHYSTFDVTRGAKVIFGPAGRPLPQLPLRIEANRELVAAGGLSGAVGPAWWGVRKT
jgi:ubiquinol-cytochrome c reductase iron-sulfur subunit